MQSLRLLLCIPGLSMVLVRSRHFWKVVRRGLAMALLAASVVGVASSVGAQVDSINPGTRSVWAASCLGPGGQVLVVYGRGFGIGPVGIQVADQDGSLVGGLTATATARSGSGAVFQSRVALSVPSAGVSALRLVANQGEKETEHRIVVSGACAPTLNAVSTVSCALSGDSANVAVTVRGADLIDFDRVVHHADLYGPTEVVDRRPLRGPQGEYSLSLLVANVPNRVIPVTLEARRLDGAMVYATADVALPPSCAPPTTTTTPTTSVPTISPGAVIALPPLLLPPGTSGVVGQGALSLTTEVGRTGETTTVSGRGFPPLRPVTLRWRPGIGEWTVTPDADGTFRTPVLVLPNDIEGPRVLEVVQGGVTPVPYLVVPSSYQPAFGGMFVRG